jgi:opacity protein-like surface antigen
LTGSFDDDADSGYLVSGSFELTEKWSIHASIMESEMDSSDRFSDPNSNLDAFRYIGSIDWTGSFDAADSVKASYFSELSGLDVNAVYRFSDSVDFMVGIGQMDLEEKFKIDSVDPGSLIRPDGGTYKIRTENDMFGPHLGVAWNTMFSEKWGGYLVGKVGWYENDSEQRQRVEDNVVRTNKDSDSDTSMVTDIRLGLNYHFSDQFAVNAGYQLIQISDVALAESQFYDSAPPGSNDIDSSGEIDWDGFNLGLRIFF